VAASEAAIAEIERVEHSLAEGRKDADVYVAAASRLMDFYRSRLEIYGQGGEEATAARRGANIENRLRVAAIKAERNAIFRMLRRREISSATARKLVRELDLMEARYEAASAEAH
jgi:hypothetical protein